MSSELLARLRALGVELRADGDKLRFNAPAGVMTPDLKADIAANKPALLALLRESAVAPGSPDLRVVPRSGTLPLSFGQERMWFFAQYDRESPAYNIPLAFAVEGPLDASTLHAALVALLERHEVLRCGCTTESDRPRLVLADARLPQLVPVDLTAVAASERESRARELALTEVSRSFALDRPPLLRAAIYRLSERLHWIVITTHHFVCDGLSVPVLFRDLMSAYAERALGIRSAQIPLSIQYLDYAAWQRRWMESGALEAQLAHWKQVLSNAPAVLELPPTRIVVAPAERQGGTHAFSIDEATSAGLRELSRNEHVTLFMTVMAAFQVLLHRYTQQNDLVVATAVSSRTRAELEPLIGFFANNLLIRGRFDDNPAFRRFLQRTRETMAQALENQDLPFERLVEELRPERNVHRTPLFQAMLVMHAVRDAGPIGPWRITPLRLGTGVPKFEISVEMSDSGSALHGTVEYRNDAFDPHVIESLFEQFQTLLQSIVANPETRVRELSLVATDGRQRAWDAWNRTDAPFPGDLCLHELFERQTDAAPDALALIDDCRSFTYAEVEARANALAQGLREYDVGPNTLVAIVMEKGWEQVVATLAILKAGAAYLPIDAGLPVERMRHLLRHGEVQCALTQARWKARVAWPDETTVFVVDAEEPIAAAPRPSRRQRPSDLAYVIYTSGSTGLPKGVMIDHLGALNTVLDVNRRIGTVANDRWLGISALNFDLSVYDIFGPFAAGGALVLPRADRLREPSHWADLVSRFGVTVWNTVPALADLLVENVSDPGRQLKSLRVALLSGDWIPVSLPDRIRKRIPGARIVSMGGATEASIWSIWYDVDHVDPRWRSIPYGRAMDNQRFYVLDETYEPSAIGVPGPLYIGGIGLAKGYWRDEEKTGAAFIRHPRTGDRLYRTGDMGRYLPDGNIEFLGRRDFQVKVNGYRIELGEIESNALQFPGVRDAAVTVVEDEPGSKRLVGYVVPEHRAQVDFDALREHLRRRIPEYMVPNSYIALESLPLSSNGKVDRRALPKPTAASKEDRAAAVPPRDDTERRVLELFAEVLGDRTLGVNHSFFDHGGHSLKAVRLMSALERSFGRRFPLSIVFERGTPAQIAALVRDGVRKPGETCLVPIQREGSQPPLFCVHAIGGHVLSYAALARELGNERPFYGLRAPGIEGETAPVDSVGGLADRYAATVRETQPRGPYLIAGWSFGGLVAVEVARRLRAQGGNVALLALFDSRLLRPEVKRIEVDQLLAMRLFIADLAGIAGARLPDWHELLAQVPPGERLRAMFEQAQRSGLIASPLDIEDVRHQFDVFRANVIAERSYEPSRVDVPIDLFAAGASEEDGLALGEWQVATESLRVHTVPGTHFTMLQPPHVAHLATELKRAIAASEDSAD